MLSSAALGTVALPPKEQTRRETDKWMDGNAVVGILGDKKYYKPWNFVLVAIEPNAGAGCMPPFFRNLRDDVIRYFHECVTDSSTKSAYSNIGAILASLALDSFTLPTAVAM